MVANYRVPEKTGMRLKDIKSFIEMAMQGDKTIEHRLELIVKQKESVQKQIAELNETLLVLEFKKWYYTTAKKYGSTSVPKNIPLNQLPEQFQNVRIKLCGK